MDISVILMLILAGVAGGFIAGLLGIGGGPIYVLIYYKSLVYYYPELADDNMIIQIVIANSIFSAFFAGFSASVKQYQANNFFGQMVLYICLPAIVTAILVTYAISFVIDYSSQQFTILFSIFLIPLVIKTLFTRELGSNMKNESSLTPPRDVNKWYLIGIGLISGVVTSLSGLGGGFVIIPLLNGVLRYPIKRTLSISLGVIALVALILSAFNLFIETQGLADVPYAHGTLVLSFVLPVIIGVIFAAPFGVQLSHKLSPKVLKILFTIFAVLVVANLIFDLI